jgi:hypothetical protein
MGAHQQPETRLLAGCRDKLRERRQQRWALLHRRGQSTLLERSLEGLTLLACAHSNAS